jgi:hypothetical protein
MATRPPGTVSDLILDFRPESDLERAVARSPELLTGLGWGKPRRGHPEGSVAAHVEDLLRKLDDAGERGERRQLLRFVALVHDSFKYQVDQRRPKHGENHHAMRARRFAERFTSDERLLSIIELHDRPYAVWRRRRRSRPVGVSGLEVMLERLPDRALFARFVELDGSTEGKSPEPLLWFQEALERRGASMC